MTLRQAELQEAKERFIAELSQKIRRVEQGLSIAEKEDLLAEFEKEKVGRVNRKSWQQYGLESPLIRPLWEKFIQERYLTPDESVFKMNSARTG